MNAQKQRNKETYSYVTKYLGIKNRVADLYNKPYGVDFTSTPNIFLRQRDSDNEIVSYFLWHGLSSLIPATDLVEVHRLTFGNKGYPHYNPKIEKEEKGLMPYETFIKKFETALRPVKPEWSEIPLLHLYYEKEAEKIMEGLELNNLDLESIGRPIGITALKKILRH